MSRSALSAWLITAVTCGPQVMIDEDSGDTPPTSTSEDEPDSIPPGGPPPGADSTTDGGGTLPPMVTTSPPATTTTGPPDPTTTGITDSTTTGEPPPVGADCDLWTQDCGPGQKCVPWADNGSSAWNAAGCFPVDPMAVPVGDTCIATGGAATGYDNCELGSICWDVDSRTDEGHCVAQCTNSPAMPVCADPDTACAITNDGVIQLCLPVCDPLLIDCNLGEVCVPVVDNFFCVPDASGDAGAYNDTCENINACDPGLMCINAASLPNCASPIGCCTAFCDLTVMPDPCPEAGLGASCQPYFEEGVGPPQFDPLGVCALP